MSRYTLLCELCILATASLFDPGGNPAANAALCDGAFVANRFRVVEVRREAQKTPAPQWVSGIPPPVARF